MDWSKYSSLKSGSKVSFGKEKQVMREAVAEVKYKKGDDDIPDHKKVGDVKVRAEAKDEREYVAMSQKRWDAQSGEAQDDSKQEYSLSDLEREKSRADDEMASAKAQSDGLKAAIADFKKL
jgi:hypothetical protein